MPRTAVAIACVVALTLALGVGALAQEQERRISLDLRDADLQSALTMLFKDTNKSFVLEEGARGQVNASLNDVPWESALRAVLESLNLTAVRTGDIYRVGPGTIAAPPIAEANTVEQQLPSPPPTGATTVTAGATYRGGSTAEGALYLGIIPVRHASVIDMAMWFGGVAATSTAAGAPGLGGYGIGNTQTISPTIGAFGTGIGTGIGTGYPGLGSYGTGTIYGAGSVRNRNRE